MNSEWNSKQKNSENSPNDLDDFDKSFIRQNESYNDNMYSGDSGDEFGSDDDIEGECAIHSKDLDMVCMEVTCETPVCSNCILIGGHKNHMFMEKVVFFRNLESESRSLLELQREIDNNAAALDNINIGESVIARLKSRRELIEKNIEEQCQKLIREIEARESQVKSETKMYFEQLEKKLEHYINNAIDAVHCNDQWRERAREALKLVDMEDIDKAFLYKKRIMALHIKDNGERFINNIAELQALINNKINECVLSFQLEYNPISQDLITTNEQEVLFKQDIREKMRICLEGNKMMITNQNSNIDLMQPKNDPLAPDLMASFENNHVQHPNLYFSQTKNFNNPGHQNLNMNRAANNYMTQTNKGQFSKDNLNVYRQGNTSIDDPTDFPDNRAHSKSLNTPSDKMKINTNKLCKLVFISMKGQNLVSNLKTDKLIKRLLTRKLRIVIWEILINSQSIPE